MAQESGTLYGVALSILRDRGEAEDAVQESLVKAWRSWNDVRDEAARRVWGIRICVNHCIDRRNRLFTRRFFQTDPLDGRRHQASDQPRAEGRLVDLDRAYLQLSVKQRAALVLHVYYGYSITQCADLMHCRAGSVRTHLARAIARMRKELSDVEARS